MLSKPYLLFLAGLVGPSHLTPCPLEHPTAISFRSETRAGDPFEATMPSKLQGQVAGFSMSQHALRMYNKINI